jgi:protein-S-isoprenylcysteine O-methyltransferase Ste14
VRFLENVAIGAALLLGAGSLSLFGLFLFLGPLDLVTLDVSAPVALGIDAALSLLFFAQHSTMIRRSFRQRSGKRVPDHFHGAIYTVASGIVLLLLLILWQPVGPVFWRVDGGLRWLLRGGFLAAVLCFYWGVQSLGSFDAFGIRSIKAASRGEPSHVPPLAVRGPYRWVRHPLYTCVLVMIWCYPVGSADRLLFNVVWTVWIFLGTVLEERDLVAVFGDAYREYQKTVPMLIPWRRVP